ncbi:hypothetical protein AVEN_220451-1 [Araneus ventricosus]|uniref:Uncharacterized protein n=1 Tax=Araneus ventricosus TaxID=182803 RepID=A0A4Y2MJH1_ARAVE|nr:hypothetical protein AVEN_220451-1 [Araneus ventricosus]
MTSDISRISSVSSKKNKKTDKYELRWRAIGRDETGPSQMSITRWLEMALKGRIQVMEPVPNYRYHHQQSQSKPRHLLEIDKWHSTYHVIERLQLMGSLWTSLLYLTKQFPNKLNMHTQRPVMCICLNLSHKTKRLLWSLECYSR